jgi:hypothetical protein
MVMRWKNKLVVKWRPYFAWYPIQIDGTWVWLERVERKVEVMCDHAIVDYRFPGVADEPVEPPVAQRPTIEAPVIGPPMMKPADMATWLYVEALFQQYRMPQMPARLRDEIVVALEWAWFGHSAQKGDGDEL